MDTRSRIALLGTVEMAKLKATLASALGDSTVPPERALELLAGKYPFWNAPPQKGAGRPRDPQLDRAARLYVGAVDSKEMMRAMGYGGLKPEKSTLLQIAKQCFPNARGKNLAKAEERIKNAARKYRQKSR